jgi:hypothetical protein
MDGLLGAMRCQSDFLAEGKVSVSDSLTGSSYSISRDAVQWFRTVLAGRHPVLKGENAWTDSST